MPRSLSEHILIQWIVILFVTRVQIVYKIVMVYLIVIFVSLNLFAFVHSFISLQIPFSVNFRWKVDIAGGVSSQKKK